MSKLAYSIEIEAKMIDYKLLGILDLEKLKDSITRYAERMFANSYVLMNPAYITNVTKKGTIDDKMSEN